MTEDVKSAVLAGPKEEDRGWDRGAVVREPDELLVSLLRGQAEHTHIL